MPADTCSGEGRTHWLACPCREEKAEALAEALRSLVAANEQWNEAMDSVIGRQPNMPGQRDALAESRAALAAWEGRTEAADQWGDHRSEVMRVYRETESTVCAVKHLRILTGLGLKPAVDTFRHWQATTTEAAVRGEKEASDAD